MKAARRLVSRRQKAFTLIELLVVIGIIGLLTSILVPALMIARSRARAMMVRTEVKSLEAALNQYYMQYQRWPTELFGTSDGETEAVPITDDMAKLLRGIRDSLVLTNNNPMGLRFMDFDRKRFNSEGNPVGPWGDLETSTNYFYAKFDMNYDNVISAGDPLPKEEIRRDVIVWMYDPDRKEVLGSWSQK
jgi:prepilin-type N-terminal cleavage/methylation domain-containing protein